MLIPFMVYPQAVEIESLQTPCSSAQQDILGSHFCRSHPTTSRTPSAVCNSQRPGFGELLCKQKAEEPTTDTPSIRRLQWGRTSHGLGLGHVYGSLPPTGGVGDQKIDRSCSWWDATSDHFRYARVPKSEGLFLSHFDDPAKSGSVEFHSKSLYQKSVASRYPFRGDRPKATRTSSS